MLLQYHVCEIELPIIACVQTMMAATRKTLVMGLIMFPDIFVHKHLQSYQKQLITHVDMWIKSYLFFTIVRTLNLIG